MTKTDMVRIVAASLCLCAMGYSTYKIWFGNNNYLQEERVRLQMEQYHPAHGTRTQPSQTDQPKLVNQGVIDAQELNPDIVGWLTLKGTRIDYPFVQATDNDFYLRRDINKDYSYAGTLFMDYRSASDFSSFSGIIYGHNMQNGTMFSDIERYDDATFFATVGSGTLFLSDATYLVEPFAYMLVNSDDSRIYATDHKTDDDKKRMLDYIAETALRYRDLSLTVNDRLLVLSTCSDDFNQARSVVVVRLIQGGPDTFA